LIQVLEIGGIDFLLAARQREPENEAGEQPTVHHAQFWSRYRVVNATV
jgi:hypothetical protein